MKGDFGQVIYMHFASLFPSIEMKRVSGLETSVFVWIPFNKVRSALLFIPFNDGVIRRYILFD